ncbi:MAG TPA: DUF58 domain-containing protein [Gemmatimonadales bacterium]|nr:DUF58 domain-containing protein [Gemmatimonadales bacterium]
MVAFVVSGLVLAGFVGLWIVLGTPRGSSGGVLWTPRALSIAAALAVIGVLGFWVPWALDAMLVADAVLIALIWLDATLALRVSTDAAAPAASVLVSREPIPALSVGHVGEVTYRWTNASARRARLEVREIRPDILGGAQSPRVVGVAADATTTDTVPVVPLRRGREVTGGFFVDSIGPLGLGRRRLRFELPWEVVVYPSLASVRLRASVAEALRRRDAGTKPVRQLGEGRLFESLREWVPGDDLRHIDWKATARRRKVITRQYEAERRQQVLLVLDTGRLMTAEVTAGVARLDFAVQAALELAYAAAQYDDNVGVMTFADGVQHFVAPERGRTGVRRVLDVLAVVQPKLVEPDYPGAFRYLAARNRKRALTVLFTDVIDRFASDALVANVATLRPRHLPLAVTLRNPELDAAATLRPETPQDAFRKAAAEELLHAREEALGHMRRAGVLVIDVTPQRAAQAVVAKYLDLKRRGTL